MDNIKKFCSQKIIPLVYDDTLSYYECICKLQKYINDLIDAYNNLSELDKQKLSKEEYIFDMIERRKLDSNGNFTGSWFGITEPVYSEPGIQGQVLKTMEDLENLRNELIATENINYIYVDKLVEQTENTDGKSPETAFNELNGAIKYLLDIGSKTEFKKWIIKIKGYGTEHTYKSCYIKDLPFFASNLIIQGDKDLLGNPITVFQSTDINDFIGIRIEPARGNSFMLENLAFKDYKNGFNGYGVLMKNQGYIYCLNCQTIGCDCGFAGVNNVTLTCQRCVAHMCDVGFKSLYNGTMTVGSGTGGSHYADGGNGCEVINCNKGTFISRNSVAHSDYVKYKNCTMGVNVDMNCRVATLANIFEECASGVICWSGSEWNRGTGNEIDTFIECTTPYDVFGVSRETRTHCMNTKNMFIFDNVCQSDIVIPLAIMNNQEIYRSSPSTGCLPLYYLDRNDVKLKITIRGSFTGNGEKTFSAKLLGLDTNNNTTRNDIDLNSITFRKAVTSDYHFTLSWDVLINQNNYGIFIQGNTLSYVGDGGAENRIAHKFIPTKPNTIDKKQLRLYCSTTDATDSIKIFNIEYCISN